MAKQLNVNLAFTADTSKARAEINSLQQSLAKISSGVGLAGAGSKITANLQEASQAANQLQIHLQKAVNLNTGTLNFTAFNQSVKKSGTSIEDLGNSLLKAGSIGQQSFTQLTAAIAKSEVPLTRMGTTMAKFGQTLKNTINWQISSSMIHGFIGAIQGAYNYAKDLNESLNNIRIVTGQSADQMARFAEQANKAAKQLSTTTTRYTDAALIYYQQGLSDSEVKDRTDVTVKLANAAGISAEAASTQLTAIWNNFDNGTKSLEHYADVLVKLGAETASSSEEISQGMQKFAAVAETVGLSYEYAAAALATVTATTRQSADTVGTAFKTLFARLEGLQLGETLEDGTDLNKYSKALATVGVNIKDASGEMKNMDTILDELGNKWKNLGKDQQVALAQTVGGMRQYTQLVALMDNWDFFKENVNRAQGADGALQKQQDIYAESWEAAANRVKAAQQAIFQDLLKDKGFIGILNIFEKLLTGVDNFIDGLGGLKGILLSIGTIATTVFGKKLASGLDSLGTGLKTMLLGPQIAQAQKQITFDRMVTSYLQSNSDNNYIPNSRAAEAQTEVYEKQLTAQGLYMNRAPQMSEAEKMVSQTALDNINRLGEKRVAAEARAEAINQQYNWTRSSLFANPKVDQNALDTANSNIQLQEKLFKLGSSPKAIANITEEQRETLATQVKNSGLSNAEEIGNKILGLGKNSSQTADELRSLSEAAGQLSGVIKDNLKTANVKDKKTQEKYTEDYRAKLRADEDAEGATSDHKQASENFKNQMNASIKMSGTEQIVTAASAFMSLGMAASSAYGVIQAWNNQDLSFGEKLMTTLTSGGMAVMMLAQSIKSLMNVTQSLGIVTKIADAVSKKHIVTKFAETTASKVLATADEKEAEAIMTATAARIGYNVAALATLAAVTAIVGVIYLIAQAHVTEAEAAEKAAKAAQGLKEEESEAKQELENIKNTLNTYDTAVEKLNSCTKGTEEWRDALAEVNSLMLDILTNSPELSSKIRYERNEDGMLEITNADEIIEEAENKADLAQQATIIGNEQAQQANLNLQKKNFLDQQDNFGAYNQETGEYVRTQNIVDNLSNYTDEQGNLLSIKELNKKLFGSAAEEFGSTVSDDFYTALRALAQATTNYATQVETSSDLIAEQELGNEYGAAAKKIAADAYFKDKEDIYNEVIKQGTDGISKLSTEKDKDAQALWTRYVNATGNTNYQLTGVTGIDSNRKFTYSTGAGQEAKEISLEVMAAEIAATEALTQLTDSAVAASTALNKIDTVDGQDQETSDLLKSYIATGTFDQITNSQRDAMEGWTSDDWKNAFGGQENVEKLADMQGISADDFIANVQEAFTAIDFDSIGNTLKGKTAKIFNDSVKEADDTKLGETFNKLAIGEQKALETAFAEVAKEGGSSAVQSLVEGLSGLENLDLSQIQEILKAISNTDWSDPSSVQAFNNKLYEISGATEGTLGPLDAFITRMKEIAGVAETRTDAESIHKTMSEIGNSVKGFGDTITPTQYEAMLAQGLDPSQWFTKDLNGNYAFTSTDIDGFQDWINEAGISGFRQIMEDNASDADFLQSYTQEEAQELTEKAYTESEGYRPENVQNQLDLLKAYGLDQNNEVYSRVSDALANGENIANADLDSLAEQASDIVDQYDQWDEKAKALTEDNQQMQEALDLEEAQEAIEEYDVSLEDAASLANSIKDNSDLKLSKQKPTEGEEKISYGASEEEMMQWAAAAIAAKEAAEEMPDKIEDWKKALNDLSKKQNKTNADLAAEDKILNQVSKDLKKYLGQTKDVPKSLAKWAVESGKLEKALQGDADAFYDMKAAALLTESALDGVITAPQEAAGKSWSDLIDLMSDDIQNINSLAENLQIFPDANIMAGQFAPVKAALEQFINDYASTTEEAQKLAADMGYDVEIVEGEPEEVTDIIRGNDYTTVRRPYGIGGEPGIWGISEIIPKEEEIQSEVEPRPAFKIQSGKYTGGGNFNKSSGGGKGGGGGGGKPKPPKPHKRIDPKVRFEGTKKQIDILSKKQELVNAKKEVTFGQEKIKQAEKEIALKQRQIKLQAKLMEETQEALELQKIDTVDRLSKITGVKIEFDVDGSIANLDKIEEAILDLENKIIDLENAEADEFVIAAWQEKLDMAREGFDDLLDIIEENLDAENAFFEAINELADLNLELVQIKVDLDISLAEAELEYIDYLLEKLTDEGFEAAEAITVLGDKANNALSQIETYRKGIAEILANRGLSVDDLMNMDVDDLIGLGFTQAEIDALLEYRSAIIENMSTLNELRSEMIDKVSAAFGTFSDELSRQIDLFEHYSGLLEHFGEIATLTGSRFAKSELRDLFSSIDNAAMANGQANIRAAKSNLDDLRSMYETYMTSYAEAKKQAGLGENDTIFEYEETRKEMEDDLREAEETFYSAWEDTLSKAADILERWVEDAGARFEEVLSPMYQSLDRLEEAYDRMKEQDENYYDNYEQLYYLSQLTRDINNSIDDTDNIKSKQRLRDLMKEITDIQARGVELSEYDVDVLRKRYELEQARQALEDASDNASIVRLQRDQEGNWGYVYTADEDAVDEAEKEYENKLYELQKANDEYIKELQDRILELTTDCKEQLADIAADTTLSPEEKERLSKEISDFYNSQLEYLTSQMDGALANQNATLGLMLSIYDTTKDQLLDTWEETNLSLLGMYNNTGDMFAGLTGAMNGYIRDLWEGIENFDNNLNNTNIAAGSADAFGTLAEEIGKIGENTEETEQAVESLGDTFVSEFETIMTEVTRFEEVWGTQIDSAIDKNEEFVSSLLEVISLLALVNTDDKEFTDAYNEYKAAQQKYLESLDGTISPSTIRYGLVETNDPEWEAAKRKFEEFMTQWMAKHSGGIMDSGEAFDTGGYTGEWGPEGRLAWLHQKELILNPVDTENLLDAVAMVKTLELNVGAFTDRLSEVIPSMMTMERGAFQQEIYITAEFTEATSAVEIQEAFENLINDATQYAYSR